MFSKEIAAAADNADAETVAEHYINEINAVYFTAESRKEDDEKQEEKKTVKAPRKPREIRSSRANCSTRSLARDEVSITAEEKKLIRP